MRIGFRELVFSGNCFCAAMLALYISLYCDLDRPYWAMMTVYVASQPFSGAVRSKAVYRLLGTLLGAATVVLILPPLSNAPILLSLALAVWVGGCLFFSLLDRTPRSYIFLLAGYTATFIGFPAVNAPASIFDMAVSRVEEIGIGVICSALFHTVFFPRSVSRTLSLQFKNTISNLQKWADDTLTRDTAEALDQERHKLAANITGLHMLATHVPFDTHEPARVSAALAAEQDRLIYLFPIISGLSDRMLRLEKIGALSNDLLDLIKKVKVWIQLPPQQMTDEKPKILKECQELRPKAAHPLWPDLLKTSLIIRLCEFIEAFVACFELSQFFHDPKAPLSQAARNALNERTTRPLHKDYGAALWTAIATTGTILVGCWFWIITGWPEGDYALMMTSVTCCLFASFSNPLPMQRAFLFYTMLAVIASAIYVFAVLPLTHSFVTLMLVLAPALLTAGAFMALPEWAGIFLPLIIPFCGGLSVTRTFNPDFALYANRNIAQLIGIAAVIFVTGILHDYNAGQNIQRVMKAAWKDLAQLASSPKAMTAPEWVSTMVDRIGLLAPYVKTMKTDEQLRSADLMRDLRTGLNVIHLQNAYSEDALRLTERLDLVAAPVGTYYRELDAKGFQVPPETLLTTIDNEIRHVTKLEMSTARDAALNALTALRCTLFPQAEGYLA